MARRPKRMLIASMMQTTDKPQHYEFGGGLGLVRAHHHSDKTNHREREPPDAKHCARLSPPTAKYQIGALEARLGAKGMGTGRPQSSKGRSVHTNTSAVVDISHPPSTPRWPS
eukprot:scaffold6410_cov107-Isochrysis_galbana.AAC.8